MIEVPRLTETDLEIFKKKKVVIYHYSEQAKELYNVLRYLKITVVAFCSDEKRYRFVFKDCGVPVISSDKLARKKEFQNVLIQLSTENIDWNKKEGLQKLGFEFSKIPVGYLLNSYSPFLLFRKLKSPLAQKAMRLKWTLNRQRLQSVQFNLLKCVYQTNGSPLFLCMPMKTGDYTLNCTLENNKEGVKFHNVFHKPMLLRKSLRSSCESVKIITAVREPIGQNLSVLYQGIANGQLHKGWALGGGDINYLRDEVFSREKSQDAQCLFDAFIHDYVCVGENAGVLDVVPLPIQSFVALFNRDIIDITKYPFDKEKGYSILREGNTEVFVYQLEKLNDLVGEIAAWSGVSFDKFKNANQASDKWVAESYAQAQEEIVLTQEYFDRCFNEPYIAHCYSKADIMKFKSKWQSHIKSCN